VIGHGPRAVFEEASDTCRCLLGESLPTRQSQ
jgi:hypothetical protein